MARRAPRLVALWCLAAGPAAAQLRVTAVPIGGPAGVDSLARLGFEVAEVRGVDGRLFAVIVSEPRSEQRLAAVGYLVQPLAIAPTAAIAPADTYRVYRSFEKPVTGIRATLAAWAAADTLIHVDSIGASLEGRPILAVKIGAATDAPGRPNVLFLGTHQETCAMTRAEQETIFRYAADEDVVSVFTAHPPTARKVERLGYAPHKVSMQGVQPVGWFYKVPVREFRWRVGAVGICRP